MSEDKRRVAALDAELVSIIRDFMILAPLSWPRQVMDDFLRGADGDNYRLPKVSYPAVDYSGKIDALNKFIKKLGKDRHPAINFLRSTARSYLYAYYILRGAGTADVSEFSHKLYGGPKDYLPGYKRRNVDVARYFLRIVEDYKLKLKDEELVYDASSFRRALQKRVNRQMNSRKDKITITVDDNITARATAGPNYVKIRKGAMFSESDLLQLLHHEVMTHTLTYINGRKQPFLKTLGYTAPRTTGTQEGLAVFAEYINLSIELVRLKRIALRIIAIDMAEKGADFIDLFSFYKKHEQNNEDSYYSAMRIFRGGVPKGGIIFYKDNVYLRGLIEVSSFLKKSTHEGSIQNISLLFAGKLTTRDIKKLHPLIEEGHIIGPTYLPPWAEKIGELASHLAFNDLTERFKG